MLYRHTGPELNASSRPCLTCSFSCSVHSVNNKLSILKTITNHLIWHKTTEEAKALSLHCEMNLQTTTHSPHQEAPSALLSSVKAQALCSEFLGQVNYPKMKIHAIPLQQQQVLGQYSKNTVCRRSDSHIKLNKTETGIFAAE